MSQKGSIKTLRALGAYLNNDSHEHVMTGILRLGKQLNLVRGLIEQESYTDASSDEDTLALTQDLVRDYFASSPECIEITKILDMGLGVRGFELYAAIMDIFAWIIDPSMKGHVSSTSEILARIIINNYLWNISYVLSAEDSKIVLSGMRLVSALANHSLAISKEFTLKFTWDSPPIKQIPSKVFTWKQGHQSKPSANTAADIQKSKEQRERDSNSVSAMKMNRKYYIGTVLTLLQWQDVELTTFTLQIKGFVSRILRHLGEDSLPAFSSVIGCFQNSILLNATLPISIKSQFYNGFILDSIISLYFISDYHRTTIHKFLSTFLEYYSQNHFQNQGASVSQDPMDLHDEAQNEMSDFVQTDSMDASLSQSKLTSSTLNDQRLPRLQLAVLLRLIFRLRPNEDLVHQGFVLEILSTCPQLIASYLVGFPYHFDPRASYRWVAQHTLLSKIFALPISSTELLQTPFLDPSTLSFKNPTIMDLLYPLNLSKTALTQSILRPVPLIRYFALTTTLRILERYLSLAQSYITLKGMDASLIDVTRWPEHEAIVKVLPDVSVILSVAASTEKLAAPHPSFQTNSPDVAVDVSHELSQYHEIMEVSHDLVLSRIFSVLTKYIAIVPELTLESRVDQWKFLQLPTVSYSPLSQLSLWGLLRSSLPIRMSSITRPFERSLSASNQTVFPSYLRPTSTSPVSKFQVDGPFTPLGVLLHLYLAKTVVPTHVTLGLNSSASYAAKVQSTSSQNSEELPLVIVTSAERARELALEIISTSYEMTQFVSRSAAALSTSRSIPLSLAKTRIMTAFVADLQSWFNLLSWETVDFFESVLSFACSRNDALSFVLAIRYQFSQPEYVAPCISPILLASLFVAVDLPRGLVRGQISRFISSASTTSMQIYKNHTLSSDFDTKFLFSILTESFPNNSSASVEVNGKTKKQQPLSFSTSWFMQDPFFLSFVYSLGIQNNRAEFDVDHLQVPFSTADLSKSKIKSLDRLIQQISTKLPENNDLSSVDDLYDNLVAIFKNDDGSDSDSSDDSGNESENNFVSMANRSLELLKSIEPLLTANTISTTDHLSPFSDSSLKTFIQSTFKMPKDSRKSSRLSDFTKLVSNLQSKASTDDDALVASYLSALSPSILIQSFMNTLLGVSNGHYNTSRLVSLFKPEFHRFLSWSLVHSPHFLTMNSVLTCVDSLSVLSSMLRDSPTAKSSELLPYLLIFAEQLVWSLEFLIHKLFKSESYSTFDVKQIIHIVYSCSAFENISFNLPATKTSSTEDKLNSILLNAFMKISTSINTHCKTSSSVAPSLRTLLHSLEKSTFSPYIEKAVSVVAASQFHSATSDTAELKTIEDFPALQFLNLLHRLISHDQLQLIAENLVHAFMNPQVVLSDMTKTYKELKVDDSHFKTQPLNIWYLLISSNNLFEMLLPLFPIESFVVIVRLFVNSMQSNTVVGPQDSSKQALESFLRSRFVDVRSFSHRLFTSSQNQTTYSRDFLSYLESVLALSFNALKDDIVKFQVDKQQWVFFITQLLSTLSTPSLVKKAVLVFEKMITEIFSKSSKHTFLVANVDNLISTMIELCCHMNITDDVSSFFSFLGSALPTLLIQTCFTKSVALTSHNFVQTLAYYLQANQTEQGLVKNDMEISQLYFIDTLPSVKILKHLLKNKFISPRDIVSLLCQSFNNNHDSAQVLYADVLSKQFISTISSSSKQPLSNVSDLSFTALRDFSASSALLGLLNSLDMFSDLTTSLGTEDVPLSVSSLLVMELLAQIAKTLSTLVATRDTVNKNIHELHQCLAKEQSSSLIESSKARLSQSQALLHLQEYIVCQFSNTLHVIFTYLSTQSGAISGLVSSSVQVLYGAWANGIDEPVLASDSLSGFHGNFAQIYEQALHCWSIAPSASNDSIKSHQKRYRRAINRFVVFSAKHGLSGPSSLYILRSLGSFLSIRDSLPSSLVSNNLEKSQKYIKSLGLKQTNFQAISSIEEDVYLKSMDIYASLASSEDFIPAFCPFMQADDTLSLKRSTKKGTKVQSFTTASLSGGHLQSRIALLSLLLQIFSGAGQFPSDLNSYVHLLRMLFASYAGTSSISDTLTKHIVRCIYNHLDISNELPLSKDPQAFPMYFAQYYVLWGVAGQRSLITSFNLRKSLDILKSQNDAADEFEIQSTEASIMLNETIFDLGLVEDPSSINEQGFKPQQTWLESNISSTLLAQGPAPWLIGSSAPVDSVQLAYLSSRTQNFDQLHNIRSSVDSERSYLDPSFIIPLFLSYLSNCKVQTKKFISNHSLGYVVRCLSLVDSRLRGMAYTILAEFMSIMDQLNQISILKRERYLAMTQAREDKERSQANARKKMVAYDLEGNLVEISDSEGDDDNDNDDDVSTQKKKKQSYYKPENTLDEFYAEGFPYQDQIISLLTCLKNSIEHPDVIIAPMVTSFVAKSLVVQVHPLHAVYGNLNRFVLKNPIFSLQQLPMFHVMFNSSSQTFKSNRLFILRCLVDGVSTSADSQFLLRRSVWTTIQAFLDSSFSDAMTRHLILQLLQTLATRVPSAIFRLISNDSLLAWLRGLLEQGYSHQHYSTISMTSDQNASRSNRLSEHVESSTVVSAFEVECQDVKTQDAIDFSSLENPNQCLLFGTQISPSGSLIEETIRTVGEIAAIVSEHKLFRHVKMESRSSDSDSDSASDSSDSDSDSDSDSSDSSDSDSDSDSTSITGQKPSQNNITPLQNLSSHQFALLARSIALRVASPNINVLQPCSTLVMAVNTIYNINLFVKSTTQITQQQIDLELPLFFLNSCFIGFLKQAQLTMTSTKTSAHGDISKSTITSDALNIMSLFTSLNDSPFTVNPQKHRTSAVVRLFSIATEADFSTFFVSTLPSLAVSSFNNTCDDAKISMLRTFISLSLQTIHVLAKQSSLADSLVCATTKLTSEVLNSFILWLAGSISSLPHASFNKLAHSMSIVENVPFVSLSISALLNDLHHLTLTSRSYLVQHLREPIEKIILILSSKRTSPETQVKRKDSLSLGSTVGTGKKARTTQ